MRTIPRPLAAPLLATALLFATSAGGPACATPLAAPVPGSNPVPAVPSDTYLALREVAFSTHSEDVEVQAKPGEERAYGVIVEFWRRGEIVTVVAFASGDASLYFSRGGGMIGGRREPLVASAAGSLVADAQVQLADVPLVKAYPAPAPGSVTVYMLTTAGLRGAQAAEADIAAADHRLNPLFVRAQAVVSEFRAARS